MPFPSEAEVERLLVLPPPPPSPLILLLPPSTEERLARCLAAPALPSSPLPIVPHPYGSPNYVRTPLGFRAAMASLFIPPSVDHREDIPKVELPPRKRLCLTALTSGYEVGESLTVARPTRGHRADYGFIGTLNAKTICQRAEENNIPLKRTSIAAVVALITAVAVEQLIKARVSAALANHETLQNSINGYGDGSHNADTRIRGIVRTSRECTYKDFLNFQPLTFKGTEGVVVLSQWFEKMESVFHISNCAMDNQVKFATYTFLGNALTWWNSHMKTVTQDVTYAMD
ncbi:hypothetical protein Tco_0496060 [Tanacetum coccineum]